MATSTLHFVVDNPQQFKQQLLAWASKFNTVVYLDSNQYPNDRYAAYECLLAVANNPDKVIATANNLQKNSFEQLQQFHEQNPGWIFGFLGYDLKNETENLQSVNFDGILLPDMFFFCARDSGVSPQKQFCRHNNIARKNRHRYRLPYC